MANLIISVVVAFLILGGPLTLFALIKILGGVFSAPKARFVKIKSGESAKLALLVDWDPESFDREIFRVRVDIQELVRGGRSSAFSFTFQDKGSKKKSFVIPMQLAADDLALLTDAASEKTLARTQIVLEVETTTNETRRCKIKKKAVQQVLAGEEWTPEKGIDVLPDTAPDSWALLTRVFPWRKLALVAEAPAAADAAAHKPKEKKAAGGPAQIADFAVTKVWIEPGCIVCDACENEAPLVFQVLADTCIVRENAPLEDALSIRAAADGCPVNVIKYTSVPKSA